MAPPRLILILVSVLTLTFILTFLSLVRSHPRRYAASESPPTTEKTNFRSFFSFRTPSALFPSSAIISLADDNSTFFLARPADFGPNLPADGLSGQLWVGSGFGDDNLGRGLATEAEGELGCSDVPGWRHGRKHRQGDGQFEPSGHTGWVKPGDSTSGLAPSSDSEVSVLNIRRHRDSASPSDGDGTDDHLHHPLPSSQVMWPAQPGRSAELQHHQKGQLPQHADIQSLQESAEITGKLVLLSRGGCGFLEKVKWVQRRGGAGLIVGDNTRGGALVTMYAKGDTSNITIPALFTSRTTAHLLSSLIPPELPDNDGVVSEDLGADGLLGQPSSRAATAGPSDDLPTFTPTAFAPRPTSTLSGKGPTRRLKEQAGKQSAQPSDKGRWLTYVFGRKATTKSDSLEDGATADSRRPPSSGRLTWVNEQWTESAIKPGNDREKLAHKDAQGSLSKQNDIHRSDVHANSGDGFEIGVHDWRDPDLVGGKAAQSSASSASITSMRHPTATALHDDGNGFDEVKALSGGSITPGSGEYQKLGVAPKSYPKMSHEVPSLSNDKSNRRSWLSRWLWGNRPKEVDYPREIASTPYGFRNGQPTGSSNAPASDNPAKHDDREGLWVTLTPTTMSTSPFFDTLLVLVVSPLITLTVVYSLLLIRSRIRRRRWRAPKSVVDRLPVRTYHTMSCSSTTSSSEFGTPRASSPTSPLLQHSPRSTTSRSRPRSHTASGIGDAVNESLDKATAQASMKQREMTARSNARKRQYHGKQLECVVCLEEYIDGQSKVMKLPCGHEFHAECITPWLTTRRRTCPICKGDVVRSMAKSAKTSSNYTVQSEPVNAAGGEDIQVQAAEATNDSPTAAIPIPRDLTDLERGDDMAATLVNDPQEASSSRRGWRGLASFSLSAFSGEAAWRQAQADRDR
ncbi:MAG: hypothetical protein Q9225_003460 [Loekoesia sp. 1 TL-2023]